MPNPQQITITLPPPPARGRAEMPTPGPIGLVTPAGIELAIVEFIRWLFQYSALDNQGIDDKNEAPPLGLERLQLLEGKIPPSVYAGLLPLTITGEIDVAAVPSYPSILVSTKTVSYSYPIGVLELKIAGGTYDTAPEQGGRVDLLTIMDTLALNFFSFANIGEVAVLVAKDQGTPVEYVMLPAPRGYYFAELTARFELPSPTNYLSQPDFKR
jgi:hypothetical protein